MPIKSKRTIKSDKLVNKFNPKELFYFVDSSNHTLITKKKNKRESEPIDAHQMVTILYQGGMSKIEIAATLQINLQAFEDYWLDPLAEMDAVNLSMLVRAAYSQALSGKNPRMLELLLIKEKFLDDQEQDEPPLPWVVKLSEELNSVEQQVEKVDPVKQQKNRL